MRCLRDGDEVDAVIGQITGLGRRYPEVDAGMTFGMMELPGGGIGSDHVLEMRRQPSAA